MAFYLPRVEIRHELSLVINYLLVNFYFAVAKTLFGFQFDELRQEVVVVKANELGLFRVPTLKFKENF